MSSNNHAAMCVYCGDSIIYDTREVTDMAAAHAQIVEHDQQCPKNPLVARIAELEEREQALAAHVDLLSELLDQASEMIGRDTVAGQQWHDAECKALQHEPVNSLARRDALKQAETLEQVIKRWSPKPCGVSILAEITFSADNKRRQAEAPQ